MEDANLSGPSRNIIEEAASSNTYSKISERYGNHRKSYVDHSKNRSKLTCLTHGPGHSLDGCKVLEDFGSKYSKSIPTKYRGNEPASNEKFNRQQDNNSIVQHAVDDIILHKKNKLSAEDDSHRSIYSKIDKNDLYEIDNVILDEKKK